MILSILKIIGIVILVIIALLILILGILLFVPIRYQLAGEYKDKPKADIWIRWAPLLLKVTANYRDSKFEYVIRMFGGVVMTNTDIPFSWLGKKLFDSSDEQVDDDDEPENQIKTSRRRKNVGLDEPHSENSKDDVVVEKTKKTEYSQENKEVVETDSPQLNIVHSKKKTKKKSKSLYDRIRQKIQKLKAKWNQFIQKLRKLNDKRESLLKVYHSKRFKAAKQDIMIYIKTLWSVIRPKKMDGYIHFGFEDPAATGQVLGVMAMFLMWYDEFLVLEPDFEQACIDGYLNGSGKFRLFPLVKLIIKIMRNKNLIKVIKKVQTIIEA